MVMIDSPQQDKDSIEDFEKAIDAQVVQSPLRAVGGARAAWALLTVADNTQFHKLLRGELVQATYFNLNQAIDYALRTLYADDNFGGAPLELGLSHEHQKLAAPWLEKCQGYLPFCTIFPLWRHGFIGLSVQGRLLQTEGLDQVDPYDAYNIVVAKDGRVREMPFDLMQIASIVARFVRKDSRYGLFNVEFNSRTHNSLLKCVDVAFTNRWRLPGTWDFGGFTFAQFADVYRSILAIVLGWMGARAYCVRPYRFEIPFPVVSGVARIPAYQLMRSVCRQTGYSLETVSAVVGLLTFGGYEIRSPEILQQPIVRTRDDLLLLSPIVWMNTDAERNLCALLNRIPQYQAIYSRLKNEKEGLMRADTVNCLQEIAGWELKSVNVSKTDIDLAIIDHECKLCLCLEMKWFIEPSGVRESAQRAKELTKGITQARLTKSLHENDGAFHAILGIQRDYTLSTAVASMNWIGYRECQADDVPIVKLGPLIDHLLASRSLGATVGWLESRSYLPCIDKDFERLEVLAECDGYSATWRGIRRRVQEAAEDLH